MRTVVKKIENATLDALTKSFIKNTEARTETWGTPYFIHFVSDIQLF